MSRSFTLLHLTPGSARYEWFFGELRTEPLRTQMWHDAQLSVDDPAGVSYLAAVVDGQPAAWAGYLVDDGQLRCCNNYVRHGYRDRNPELYEMVYRVRHRLVVAELDLPAYTYLYKQPIGLHLADGWEYDTGPGSSGDSTPPAPGVPGYPWWRLVRTPRQQLGEVAERSKASHC